MKKYLVEIKETYYASVYINDEDEENYEEIIHNMYHNDQLELEFDTGHIVDITEMGD